MSENEKSVMREAMEIALSKVRDMEELLLPDCSVCRDRLYETIAFITTHKIEDEIARLRVKDHERFNT